MCNNEYVLILDGNDIVFTNDFNIILSFLCEITFLFNNAVVLKSKLYGALNAEYGAYS